ncbi:MAG: ABC transporter permease [Zetaproteobacteria bacterium]|nr:MAG: ABC transporter permease [Zetaproteobacteria bacterium]
MIAKEFIQMRRDRLTFAMMLGIPIIQITLFGFAINTNPKHLPAVVVAAHPSPFVREVLAEIEGTGYFAIRPGFASLAEAERLLRKGEVQFAFAFPPDLIRRAMHRRAELLVIADATDPVAAQAALGALSALPALRGSPPRVRLVVHRRYNPELRTQDNIVPGLLGVVLTMTMVLVTAVALARERERGTMEYLLITPIRPWEIIIGKLVPYIFVGYAQVLLLLSLAVGVFDVPIRGSVWLLLVAMLPFIAANLGLGVTFSTLAKNQMQAMQMSFFFFLPSILLSGFMFPFRGMPGWAQALGELLPLTHFLRIVRGILLKGWGAADLGPELAPIAAFFTFSLTLAVVRFRRTLD